MFWLLLFAVWAGVERRRFLASEHRRRAECRRFGHVGLEQRGAAPVCEFEVCRRCGLILENLSTWRVKR